MTGRTIVIAAMLGLLATSAKAAGQSSAAYEEQIHDAWLIHHGIETSTWKDPACKAEALALVDEDKLTSERLAKAMQLALNAETATCEPIQDARQMGVGQ